jgi:DNA-directed RNA polymerase subunit alpha
MIPLPQSFKVKKIKENYAFFEIEGMWPGYGTTLGNALRRVLLSSLEGAAVTEVKIKGVSHEFSVIPGVSEDALQVLMNLKRLRFKSFSDEPQKVTLSVQGEKEVKGSDIVLNPQVELANPELVIATINDKKIFLEMELTIEKGVGYVSQELIKNKKPEIGVIALDAIFTPIKSVNYKVENVRVGGRTDFDKLEIEVETDGTIDPESAFLQALDILLAHFQFVKENLKPEEKEVPVEEPVQAEEKAEAEVEEKKSAPVTENKDLSELKISSRTLKVLTDNKIKTVAGLTSKTEEQIANLKGMGDKGMKEVRKALKKMDLDFKL